MKNRFEQRGAGSLVASVALHVGVVAVLVQIVFRYPLGQLVGRAEPDQERIQYVKLPAEPAEPSGGGHTKRAEPGAAPSPIQAPISAPITTPPAQPSDPVRTEAAGGTGTGFGDADSGRATGVVPRPPDVRIALDVGPILRATRATAVVDSALRVEIGIYNDSVAVEVAKRKPGDWTIKDRKGGTWGWDTLGIRLGKTGVAVHRVLAFPVEERRLASIHRDVLEHAQVFVAVNEFNAAVRRIRERKERERQKQLASEKQKGE